MTTWRTIDTAPKDGTLVRLKSGKYYPGHLWHWSKREKRWGTDVYTLLGNVKGWWNKSAEQPTHWKPIDEVKK